MADHVQVNREAWDAQAASYVAAGERYWATDDVSWGIFGIPEQTAGVLSGLSLDGADVVELGCGTGYVSAWLTRRGARPVGLDNSSQQLATARRLQGEHGIVYPLIHGNAEQAPLRDGSFDIAISEYGASIWCDPHRWIPEAARLLRPGGQLVFLVNGTLLMLCVYDTDAEGPTDSRLRRPYFGMHRFEWTDDPGVEFHLGYGDMIRLLRSSGFDVEDLIELQAGPDATTSYPFVDADWARQWPCEEVWKARKRDL